jgi:hypothetical protein
MFERFAESARSVVFRARDNALADREASIRPHHLLLALIDLHPTLLEGILNSPDDLQRIRHDLGPRPNSLGPPPHPSQLRLDEQSRRVLRDATEEARCCWRQAAGQRRHTGHADAPAPPTDLTYWQIRTGQVFSAANLPRGLLRWLLRRRWEVDERHILLGLLREADCPAVRVLTKQGVTIEASRKRLCGTGA